MKVCDICNGVCKGLISDHKPAASEWYCDKCHKSYPMEDQDRRMMKMQQPVR